MHTYNTQHGTCTCHACALATHRPYMSTPPTPKHSPDCERAEAKACLNQASQPFNKYTSGPPARTKKCAKLLPSKQYLKLEHTQVNAYGDGYRIAPRASCHKRLPGDVSRRSLCRMLNPEHASLEHVRSRSPCAFAISFALVIFPALAANVTPTVACLMRFHMCAMQTEIGAWQMHPTS